MKDTKKDRIILFGWIRGGGDISGWNGCLSLPRVLSLDEDEQLVVKLVPDLELLRDEHLQFKDQTIKEEFSLLPEGRYASTLEIQTVIENISSEGFYFKLYHQEKLEPQYSFGFDSHEKIFWVGKEKAKVDLLRPTTTVDLHLFIDHSIFEVFINNNLCITGKISLQNEKGFFPIISSKSGQIRLGKMDVWTLKSIW
mgnify:CR=1 FL=1